MTCHSHLDDALVANGRVVSDPPTRGKGAPHEPLGLGDGCASGLWPTLVGVVVRCDEEVLRAFPGGLGCAERGRAGPRRPPRDLDPPRLDPGFVLQESTAVGHETVAIVYPRAPRPVLNHPLAESIRGFCKQGVRGRVPLAPPQPGG